MGAYNLDKLGSDAFGGDGNGDQIEETLSMKLNSRDLKIKLAAYKELQNWKDEEMTKPNFTKSLHLTIKEKKEQVIVEILKCIK